MTDSNYVNCIVIRMLYAIITDVIVCVT